MTENKTAGNSGNEADTKKSSLSKKERLEKRIGQLQAKIQAENARLNAINRKERNGQLVALGIFLETTMKNIDLDDRDEWENMLNGMRETVEGRNLERCLAAVKRVLEELKATPEQMAALVPLLAMPDRESRQDQKINGQGKEKISPEEEISPEPPSQLPEAEAREKNQGSA